ncbi:MAG: hypothetical protein AAFU65_07490 [Pseudomonadota bacterium]
MADSKHTFLLAWALGATLVAVGAVGYSFGKRAGGEAPQAARHATDMPYTDESAQRTPPPPAYSVPESFNGVANEWRSTVRNDTTGYAVLFQPERRRIIAERCQHHGYASSDGMIGSEFCTTLVKGTLTSLETDEATLMDREGNPVTVRLNLGDDGQTLRMRFGEHDLRLMPGSRNDLMQAMEALPDVQEKKRAFILAMAGDRPDAPMDAPDSPNTDRQ